MRKKMILWQSILAVFLTLLWSCQSEDFARTETNPQRNNADFFKNRPSLSAKNATDYIRILEEYNNETDFVARISDQKGMPVWDKMYVVETETASGLMIPLSYDNATMSSLLFVTLDKKNRVTGVRDFDNAMLQNIVYNQKISVENRERLFLTFMFMDNRTFGNEQFVGIPRDLFVEEKYDDQYGRMQIKNFTPLSDISVQQDGKLFIGLTCFITYHCTHHGGGVCDGCSECQTTTCTPTIFGTTEDPFPTNGGGGGGSGGGGGPTTTGPNVPDNPCGGDMSSVFYRPGPGCGGGTIPEIDNPCKKTKSILDNPALQDKVKTLKEKVNIDGANEFGFKVKMDGTTTDVTEGKKREWDVGSLQGIKGFYHSHPGPGINIFSPPDIQSLFTNIITSGSPSTVSGIFIGVIGSENFSGGIKYFHYIIRYNGSIQDAGAISSTNYDMNDLKNFYREREKELTSILPTSPYSDNDGASLNYKGVEQLFFDTLGKMGINKNKMILHRVDDNGIVNTITLNSDGTTTAIPCP